MRLYSAPLLAAQQGEGTLSCSLPTFQGPSPSSFPAQAAPVGIIISPGWLVRGTAQISAPSHKKCWFHKKRNLPMLVTPRPRQ